VNTCGFIDAAKEESLDAIFAACREAHRRGALVASVGCLTQRYRDELTRELPELDLLLGFETQPLVDLLRVLQRHRPGREAPAAGRRRLTHAYLKISDGCDRHCTYCAIPLIKGPLYVTPPQVILEEARRALERGAQELVLVGQDTARYDAPGYGGLRRLLRDLKGLSDAWLRVMYLQPEELHTGLLELLAAFAVPYLDLPLQHASGAVLRAMGRAGDGARFLDLLAGVRAVIPEVAVRSTFITGFPGETERDFDELVAFVETAGLAVAGVFPFDPQESTRAAALSRQVPAAVREERAARLKVAVVRAARGYWDGFVGETVDVLVERGSGSASRDAVGRLPQQAPDVDGRVLLAGPDLHRGQRVRATVRQVLGYDVVATR
jgi:ribosomal protein S12 methylthiotransferase